MMRWGAGLTVVMVTSLACGAFSETPVERVEPVAPAPMDVAPEPVPTVDVDRDSDTIEQQVMMTRLPPERYANNWLVITQSTEYVEPVGRELMALAESEPQLIAPDQIHSGQFKGLMPCWITTIAGASDDRASAVEILERVKAAGIDAYLKNAGDYVGPSDATFEMCLQMRSDVGECPDGVRMAHVVDGAWQVALDLPEGVVEAAIAGAPAPKRASEYGDAWTSPLVVETLGSVAIGDAVTVQPMASETSQQCTVTGFAATTLGTPHFGFVDSDRPTCGSAKAFAVLDCAADAGRSGIALLTDEDVAGWTLAEALDGESDSDLIATVRALPMIASVYDRAVADAGDQSLQQSVRVTPASRGTARTAIVEFTFFTGEGRADCGMDDVVHRVGIAVTEQGIPVSSAKDLSFAEVVGLITLPGARQATLVSQPWFGGVQVSETCGLDVAYCDCAC